MSLALVRRTLPIIATVGLLVGCGSVSTAYAAPLPDRYTVVPPAPDLPPRIAALSGVWGGVMRTTRSGPEVMEHLLAVEPVTAVKAPRGDCAAVPAASWRLRPA
jgi:hypothetical protein